MENISQNPNPNPQPQFQPSQEPMAPKRRPFKLVAWLVTGLIILLLVLSVIAYSAQRCSPVLNENCPSSFWEFLLSPNFKNPFSGEIEDEVNSTANWQIYRNEELGYEFKYPPLGPLGGGKVILGVARYAGEMVIVFPSIEKPDIEGGIIKIILDLARTPNGERGTFAGRLVYKSNQPEKVNGLSGDSERIIIPNFTSSEDLIIYRDYHPIVEQILSTFKFVEPDMTASWKTYRNEEYGFEVKYEPDLFPRQWIDSKGFTVQFTHTPYSAGDDNVAKWQVYTVDSIDKIRIDLKSTSEYVVIFNENEFTILKFKSLYGDESERATISHNGKTFVIDSGDRLSFLNQILSTFKFIEPKKIL